MSKQALYLTVYGILKQEITEGHLKVGTLLPSEQELEAQFKVSRTTIRKAHWAVEGRGVSRCAAGARNDCAGYYNNAEALAYFLYLRNVAQQWA